MRDKPQFQPGKLTAAVLRIIGGNSPALTHGIALRFRLKMSPMLLFSSNRAPLEDNRMQLLHKHSRSVSTVGNRELKTNKHIACASAFGYSIERGTIYRATSETD